MDYRIAEALNDWGTSSRIVEAVSEFFAQDGVFVLLALLVVLSAATGRCASVSGRRGAAAAALALPFALGLGTLISGVVDRVRPFVDHPQIHLLIRHARDAGFPSDHATGSFAIAVALVLRHRRGGIVAIVVAALVAVSRVIVGAHYPGDVLAGAVLGSAVALLLWWSPARRLTDRVADAVGERYDRLLQGRSARQPQLHTRSAT
jgi:undecaprenyl-diphosphatase